MAHGLSVAAVERKGDTNALRIVASDFKTIGAPAEIGLPDRDAAIMLTFSLAPLRVSAGAGRTSS